MRRTAALILLFVFGTMLPSATVMALAAPQQLLPICCRTHGVHACMMGMTDHELTNTGPTVRQPACPFGQSPRAITTVTISADLTSHSSFGLAVSNIDRQYTADAVSARLIKRSVPRGPPSSSSI